MHVFVITILGLKPVSQMRRLEPRQLSRHTVSKQERSGYSQLLFDLNHNPQEQKLHLSSSLARLHHVEQCLPMAGTQQIFVELIN